MRILMARIAELEAAQAAEAAAEAAAEEDGDFEGEEEDGGGDDSEEAETAANVSEEEVEEELHEPENEPEEEGYIDEENIADAVDELTEDLADTHMVQDDEAGSENTDRMQVLNEPSYDDEVVEEPTHPTPDGDDDVEVEGKTAAAEAVKSQKSKREQEMDELRRLAAARKTEGGGEMSAFERMKLKKQQELDALRARGGVNNAANKSRWDTGQALVTDMSAWSRNQRLAAEEAKRKRLEASEILKKTSALGITSWERDQLQDKDEARRRAMEAKEGLHKYRKGFDPSDKSETSSPDPSARTYSAYDTEKDMEKIVSHRGDSFETPPKNEPYKKAVEEEEEEAEGAVKPSLLRARDEAATVQAFMLKPPTYSRIDIKFSFGLVVKNGTTDESLRDSETLRKCMSGTREILTKELPPPPDPSHIKSNSTVSFKIKFPLAYYDPILEPTVISIQEDTTKEPAKGKNNTRTLCKASFPVFIRDEATDEEGKSRAALTLKETKATIFKALRAAVSGGKFLK
jgi:hypothetical protein